MVTGDMYGFIRDAMSVPFISVYNRSVFHSTSCGVYSNSLIDGWVSYSCVSSSIRGAAPDTFITSRIGVYEERFPCSLPE